MAWPHAGTDWADRLAVVEHAYVALVRAIGRFEPVVVVVPDDEIRRRAEALLGDAPGLIRYVEAGFNDTWLRDTAPLTLVAKSYDTASPPAQGHSGAGREHLLLDPVFTGWGGKYEAGLDDALPRSLADAGLIDAARLQRVDFALEGGAIDSDGEGSLLTTWACLSKRHPGLDRHALAERLQDIFSVDRVLMLERGFIDGDDTDAHVDTLARFASPTSIVFQGCRNMDDPHRVELTAMASQLAMLRTRTGEPYTLHELPMPAPILDGDRRLGASYANFLIINGGVIVPSYADESDDAARKVLAGAFPGREIVTVPATDFIWQNGSVHCLTMQFPHGVLC